MILGVECLQRRLIGPAVSARQRWFRLRRFPLGVADHELAQMHHVPELPALVAQFDARLRHLDFSVQAVADRVQPLRHRLHIRGADLLAGQRQQAVRHDPTQVSLRRYLLHVLQ